MNTNTNITNILNAEIEGLKFLTKYEPYLDLWKDGDEDIEVIKTSCEYDDILLTIDQIEDRSVVYNTIIQSLTDDSISAIIGCSVLEDLEGYPQGFDPAHLGDLIDYWQNSWEYFPPIRILPMIVPLKMTDSFSVIKLKNTIGMVSPTVNFTALFSTVNIGNPPQIITPASLDLDLTFPGCALDIDGPPTFISPPAHFGIGVDVRPVNLAINVQINPPPTPLPLLLEEGNNLILELGLIPEASIGSIAAPSVGVDVESPPPVFLTPAPVGMEFYSPRPPMRKITPSVGLLEIKMISNSS